MNKTIDKIINKIIKIFKKIEKIKILTPLVVKQKMKINTLIIELEEIKKENEKLKLILKNKL